MTTESYGAGRRERRSKHIFVFALASLGELTINSTRKFRLIARIHHNVFRYGLDSCTICSDVGAYVGVGMTRSEEEENKGTFIKIHHKAGASASDARRVHET